MILVKFIFPKMLHPNDESGHIYSPIREHELDALPQKGDRIVFDPDIILTMSSPGIRTKTERYGDVFGERGMGVTSVTHKIKTGHIRQSVNIYLD